MAAADRREKAAETDRAALEIITAERKARAEKTLRLQVARLEAGKTDARPEDTQ